MPASDGFSFSKSVVFLAVTILLLSHPIEALGWRYLKPNAEVRTSFASSPINIDRANSNAYATALVELQELESEPLCHRIAARLLVGNCQLLDGQNEATVMTDTGRAARDFVDCFASSLAICDLERANFDIPKSCHKFRESVLASLPIPSQPRLHVMTAEIDRCLEGLARSDSAWSTWVSYRHKALRFCEAARADNEKDRHIVLHQKLANILESLTTQAEDGVQAQASELDRMFQKSSEDAKILTSQVDQLKASFLKFDEIIAHAISSKSKEFEVAVHGGMDRAESLQRHMEAAFHRMTVREDQLAQAFEFAIQAATKQATYRVNEVVEVLEVVAQSSTFLQAQLRQSQGQVSSVLHQQAELEKGMQKLSRLAEAVTDKQISHEGLLKSTYNRTLQIVSSLETATLSISTLQTPLTQLGGISWWPYIICPVASLIFGSYGLQPSITRNMILLGAGEIAGFMMASASTYQGYSAASFFPLGFAFFKNKHFNETALEDEPVNRGNLTSP
ncbi:hypothetical protein QQS21_004271 [Conoideocrella luteorostrata]|uniref:Nuclear membrane fusion protein Kar5 n=1 Tax=Conoideocrella luteorostrata TaxID=1105319 RepID=A0AAJ0CRQ6_9HYPO|nr:hypothetical protein QQS21_004271 [Conoideocrella luteorostrata]